MKIELLKNTQENVYLCPIRQSIGKMYYAGHYGQTHANPTLSLINEFYTENHEESSWRKFKIDQDKFEKVIYDTKRDFFYLKPDVSSLHIGYNQWVIMKFTCTAGSIYLSRMSAVDFISFMPEFTKDTNVFHKFGLHGKGSEIGMVRLND